MSIPSILVIGGGTMGAALAARWSIAFPDASLVIAETDAPRRAALAAQGLNAPEELDIPDEGFTIVVLAIKPQGFAALAPQLTDVVGEATLVSIMAGITIASLRQVTPHVARAMPNTPASIGEAASAIYAPELPADRLAQVKALFAAVGKVVTLDHEAQMHAVTALSGSGPAYMFAFMEALQQAASELGLDAATARVLIAQTLRGALLLAEQPGADAASLRRAVTSPHGTTQAALEVLEKGQFADLIVAAVRAAKARSESLS